MTEVQKNWWEIDESRPYGFISYAHHDRKAVDPIAYQLIRDGYPVWMDHDIVSGADWSEYIADHLKNASYAIIFLSQASIRSGNVRDEINFARNEGKPLIVVYLEDVSQIMPKGLHLSLDRFQAIDAYRHSFEDTVHALEGAITFRRHRKQATASSRKTNQPGRSTSQRTKTHTQPVRKTIRKKKKSRAPLYAGIAAVIIIAGLLVAVLLRKAAMNSPTVTQPTAVPETTQEPQNDTNQTQPEDNTTENTQKTISAPASDTTDYTFSSAVLSSRFSMSADDFRSFVAQQGTDVSGLNTDNGNVVLSLTDDQKNTLIQTLQNNASSAASRPGGDITGAVFDNGYTGVTLVLSGTEVSADDQSAADTLKAYGILINVLNDSSAAFKVTFNDAQGNLISTETY